MLNPDDPLIAAPNDQMLSLEQPSSGDALQDAAAAALDYYNINAIVVPAFDDRGSPIFPPGEYILDALARRYDLVDEEEAMLRPDPGVCAVCIELAQCDFCSAVAQYETHLGGTTVPTCVNCTEKYGDGRLGAGHSVYLVHLAEVPHAVREVADTISRRRGQAPIWQCRPAGEPPWCSVLHDIGFVGPYADGSMRAWLFGTRVLAEPHPQGGVSVTVHRRDDRVITLPGGGIILPSSLDPLQIREEIWREVHSTVPYSQQDILESVLRPSVRVATERALATMQAGTYRQFIDRDSLSQYGMHYRYRTMVSAERTAARVAAAQSADPVVASRMATEHPDPEVRALAVQNDACTDAALLRAAESDGTHWVRGALLDRADRPDGLVDTLAINVLTNGPSDVYLTLRLLLHPECRRDFHDALMDRVYREGPDFRLWAASEAGQAPPYQRDYVQTRLLGAATRIPHTVNLIDAILGESGLANRERIAWMTAHPQRRIQRIANDYLRLEGLPTEGSLADGLRAIGLSPRLTPLEADDAHGNHRAEGYEQAGPVKAGGPRAPAGSWRVEGEAPRVEITDRALGKPYEGSPPERWPVAPLSAVAVAVRIRRAWIGAISRSDELASSDLADAWADTELVRERATLVLLTPYDFGDGNPLDGSFGEFLRGTVTTTTRGAVTSVAWRYKEPARSAIRRAKTSDLDIYRPGDPLEHEYPSLGAALRQHVPADSPEAAREVIGKLQFAAFSQHRVWFKADSEDLARLVGTTPGAAYALHATVRTFQKNDPLYRVYSDPWGHEDMPLAH